jgi:hypothetical protein
VAPARSGEVLLQRVRRVGGLYKLNPVVTRSLKAPGFKTLEPEMCYPVFKICSSNATCLVPLQRGVGVEGFR